jgi:NADH-quinone oxidoreductase subunit M
VDGFLTLFTALPLVFAAVIPLLPLKDKGIHTAGLFGALVLFFASLGPYISGVLPTAIKLPWMPSLGVTFALGADGLSWSLVVLTTFLLVMAVLASFSSINKRLKLYYSMLFVLIGSVLGVFLARDLFVYFLFWELELIPMYLLIAIWGGPRRQFASMKFVLYTLFGSVFLVAALVGLFGLLKALPGVMPNSLFLYDTVQSAMQSGAVPLATQLLLFGGLFITFAIKLPMVPFHTWLPDAHVEAPTPVSMLLAGIMLKMGAYGLLRLCFGLFPQAAAQLAPYIGLLAMINIVYTAGVALVQGDMKKLIAYSSVSHMGFVLLGLAALNPVGYSGATFVMISHGVVSAALFMCIGTLYLRTHTREIAAYGGFGVKAPTLFYFFLLFSMASLGLPFLISFAGESLVFYGGYLSRAFTEIHLPLGILPWSMQTLTIMSATGVVIGAGYSLWLLKRLFYGPEKPEWASLKDATVSEVLTLGTLAIVTIVFGFNPSWITQRYEASLPVAVVPQVKAIAHDTPTVVLSSPVNSLAVPQQGQHQVALGGHR